MIFKVYELEKLDLNKNKYFLFYGENQGHKNEIIEKKFKSTHSDSIYQYDENDVLNNRENFFNTILNKSFFENTDIVAIHQLIIKDHSFFSESFTNDPYFIFKLKSKSIPF